MTERALLVSPGERVTARRAGLVGIAALAILGLALLSTMNLRPAGSVGHTRSQEVIPLGTLTLEEDEDKTPMAPGMTKTCHDSSGLISDFEKMGYFSGGGSRCALCRVGCSLIFPSPTTITG